MFIIAVNGSWKATQDCTLLSITAASDASAGELIVSSSPDVTAPTTAGRRDVLVYSSGANTGTLQQRTDFPAGLPIAKNQTIVSVNGGSLMMVFK